MKARRKVLPSEYFDYITKGKKRKKRVICKGAFIDIESISVICSFYPDEFKLFDIVKELMLTPTLTDMFQQIIDAGYTTAGDVNHAKEIKHKVRIKD